MVWFLVMTATAVARGPLRASEDNTSGWSLMTPEERIKHQTIIRSFKTLEACRAYQAEHHEILLSRAQALGLPLHRNRHDFCTRFQAENVNR
jgi:hypothetical protein